MVEDQTIDGTGQVVERDPDVVGMLIYTPQGRVAVQIMYRKGRPTVTSSQDVPSTGVGLGNIRWSAEAARAAIDTYDAYFGTYEVNLAKHTVTHHILAELRPYGVGAHYERRFEFHDGELWLTPTAPEEHWRVVWKRLR